MKRQAYTVIILRAQTHKHNTAQFLLPAVRTTYREGENTRKLKMRNKKPHKAEGTTLHNRNMNHSPDLDA
jgi:hypothetical protein